VDLHQAGLERIGYAPKTAVWDHIAKVSPTAGAHVPEGDDVMGHMVEDYDWARITRRFLGDWGVQPDPG